MLKLHERLDRARQLGIQVDPEDEWLLEEYTWRMRSRYVCTSLWVVTTQEKYQVALHHCIMGMPMWEGEIIDHIDCDPTNCRRANLRYCTQQENVARSFREGKQCL